MRTTNLVGLLAFGFAALALSGCDKKASAGTASGPAACTYNNPDPKFCFAPPPNYAARPPDVKSGGKETEIWFVPKDKLADTGAKGFMVKWDTYVGADFPKCKNVKENAQPGETIQDDGAGGCWQDTLKKFPNSSYHYIDFYKKGPTRWIECMSNGPPDADVDAIVAACKSIRFD